jgi:flavin-dependent dehydrogenase
MTVILDPELAPGGYAYLFVVDGEATLGMAILDGFRAVDGYFTKTVDRFREIEGVRVETGEESTAVANFFLGSSGPEKGVVRIGEAAGFQDYLFGFGIRFAIESAMMAARSITDGVPFESLVLRLKKRQEASLWNRFLYEKGRAWLPGVFIALAERSPDFRDYMRSWYRHHPLKSLAVGLVRRSWRHRNLDWNGVADAERNA